MNLTADSEAVIDQGQGYRRIGKQVCRTASREDGPYGVLRISALFHGGDTGPGNNAVRIHFGVWRPLPGGKCNIRITPFIQMFPDFC